MGECTAVLRGRFEGGPNAVAFATLVNALHDAGWQQVATQLPTRGVMSADALRDPSIDAGLVERFAALVPHVDITSDMLDLLAGCTATVENDRFIVQCASGSRERLQRIAALLRAWGASALDVAVAADGRIETARW